MPQRPSPTASSPCPVGTALASLGERLASATRELTLGGRTEATFAAPDGSLCVEALYAALGAARTGQYAALRGTLAAFLVHQREDGCVPARLQRQAGLRARVSAWLGGSLEVVPAFEGLAPTALVLWVAASYVEVTGDRHFLQANARAFERALAWLELQEATGASDDLVAGVLAYRALVAMGDMAVPRGEAVEAARHWARAARLRERLGARLWDAASGHFGEDPSGRGNLLAAACGLAAPGQARAILSRADDGLGLDAGCGFHAMALAACGESRRVLEAVERALAGAPLSPAAAGRMALALGLVNAAT